MGGHLWSIAITVAVRDVVGIKRECLKWFVN